MGKKTLTRKPGETRGRKSNTQTRKSLAERLKRLTPLCAQTIEEKLARGEPITEGEKRLLEQAWRVIEQVEGRPAQRQIVTGKLELELINDR